MKRNRVFSMVIVISIGVLAACSGGERSDSGHKGVLANPNHEEAIAIYKSQCMSCHATDLSGRVGPSLQKIGSKLTPDEIVHIIRNGGKGMPAFSKLMKEQDIQSLAKWLETLQ